MDPFDPTNVLFKRIKSLDPEHASKIIGYLLLQDLGKGDLMRLAFGSEAFLLSVIFKAKTDLGLSSNSLCTASAPPSPSPLNPISRPNSNGNGSANCNLLSQSSPRVTANGFLDLGKNPSSSAANSWSLNNSNPISPKSSPFLSYDNIRAGSLVVPSFPHQNNGNGGCVAGSSGDTGGTGDFIDEHQLNDYLSFLNDSSPKNEEFLDPRLQLGFSMNNVDVHLHRRSFSASDACFGSEDTGETGYKHCLYFARGFCKNGDNCKFVHGVFADNVDGNGVIVGSPSKIDYIYQQHEEMMRMKVAQQQRLASAQLMAGVSQFPYDKRMHFPWHPQNDSQRAAALMLGEECYRYSPGRLEKHDVLGLGLADKSNSASRQIYLTFPAESTFKDEDVSNYFSNFGPVQDVRIPYQQKRMFGFVTFVHPETVKLILARGNPHFICDSRVLVKPYKEKGKVPDKRQQHLQQQQVERGNFSTGSSPSAIDARESYDFHPESLSLPGAKLFYNTQEMLLRRKLEEQADVQQAIELQRRRFMNLQLPELKNESFHHHQRSLSVGSPVYFPSHANQNILPCESVKQEVIEVGSDSQTAIIPLTTNTAEQLLQPKENAVRINGNGCGNSKEGSFNREKSDLHERNQVVEHVLPDNLFTFPIKSTVDHRTYFSTSVEVNESAAINSTSSSCENNPALPTTSSDVASH